MSDLGNRIRKRRLELGLTQKALADACNVKQASVSAWERGDTLGVRPDNLYQASRKLRTSMEWLATGRKDRAVPAVAETRAAYLLSSTDAEIRKIPLINWSEVSDMLLSVGLPEGVTYVSTARDVGPQAYALEVQGDSMEPLFPKGATVIVDPDHPVEDGAYVIVEVEGEAEAQFKQYVREGGKAYLRPLNQRYPVAEYQEGSYRICGVVRQMVMDFD